MQDSAQERVRVCFPPHHQRMQVQVREEWDSVKQEAGQERERLGPEKVRGWVPKKEDK